MPKAPRKPYGSQVPYDQGRAEEICNRLSSGEALSEICDSPGMPASKTVFRWMAGNDAFRQGFSRARADQMSAWAEEIILISDDSRNDYMERESHKGNLFKGLDPEHMQRTKLRIETRKWVMSKLAPGLFGDKVQVDVNASVEVHHLSDEELEQRTIARLEALGIPHAGPLLVKPVAKLITNQ